MEMLQRSVTARLMAPLVVSLALLMLLAGVMLHGQRQVSRANDAARGAQDRMLALAEQRSLSRALQRDALNLVTEPDASELAAIRGPGARRALAQLITALENGKVPAALKTELQAAAKDVRTPVLGITGTGGAGKSSLTDELIRRLRLDQGDALQIEV